MSALDWQDVADTAQAALVLVDVHRRGLAPGSEAIPGTAHDTAERFACEQLADAAARGVRARRANVNAILARMGLPWRWQAGE